jgi:hypothetical protein
MRSCGSAGKTFNTSYKRLVDKSIGQTSKLAGCRPIEQDSDFVVGHQAIPGQIGGTQQGSLTVNDHHFRVKLVRGIRTLEIVDDALPRIGVRKRAQSRRNLSELLVEAIHNERHTHTVS